MRITRIIFNFTYTRICISLCEWCFMWYFFEKSPTYSCFMTFLIAGELSLPEELPEFPYEAEFIREIENAILKYGGREGVTLLKEHAIEQREVLESSMNQNLSAISIPIGTIYILRKHIFSYFGQLCVEMDFTRTFPASTKCKILMVFEVIFIRFW